VGDLVDVGQLFIDLVRVETRLYNAVDDRLRTTHGLTVGQYQLLLVIRDTPGCRVYDIVRDVAISVGAASKAVDRIEQAGWCRRRVNPRDGRSSLLTLTPAGKRLLKEATPTFDDEIRQRVVGVLAEGRLNQTGASLRALRTALEEYQATTLEASPAGGST
jgi:DNA-binding MarR family transcriptional regulator